MLVKFYYREFVLVTFSAVWRLSQDEIKKNAVEWALVGVFLNITKSWNLF